jgi:purine-binding chemotaxis protein CheW
MAAAADMQVVTCGVDAEVFAVPVTLVREILDFRAPYRLPNGPDYLLGLTDVRGVGVPTLDLRLRLGLTPVSPTPQTRVLVIDVPLHDRVLQLGLVTDRVFEVMTVATADLEPAPDIGVRWRSDYIAGVLRRPDDFVVVLDLPRLFADEGSALKGALEARPAA